MLDDLREQAASSQFDIEEEELPDKEKGKTLKVSSKLRLGMNTQQRFILSLMLFFVVFLLGVMFLFVTGKIYPPFLY